MGWTELVVRDATARTATFTRPRHDSVAADRKWLGQFQRGVPIGPFQDRFSCQILNPQETHREILFDAIDGAFMSAAYGWAFLNPVRKVLYNLTVTALSVIVALVIGVIELLGLLADKLGIHSGLLTWIGAIDLEYMGYAVAALFVVTWLIALAVWRFGRIEQRWAPTDQTHR